MFEYEDLTQEQIDLLENEEPEDLIKSALLIIYGARKGILDNAEAFKQINNVLIAAL